MTHPDFRVHGNIFATLGSPSNGWGVVKLVPRQQQVLLDIDSETYVPAAGAWGRKGLYEHSTSLGPQDGCRACSLRSVVQHGAEASRPREDMKSLASLAIVLAGAALGIAQGPAVQGLDHIPIAVKDPAAAADNYRALGSLKRGGRTRTALPISTSSSGTVRS